MRKPGLILFLFWLVACAPAIARAAGSDSSALIEDIQKKALDFFLEQQHPQTGLILDRANNFSPNDWSYAGASTAGAGFALTAYVVGAERGWITREEAYGRCLRTLRFFRDEAESKWGFYYHFLNAETGKRMGGSELSTIDSVLFFAGALTAGQYFKGTDVDTVSRALYANADWPALLTSDRRYISMGWSPEHGMLSANWESYCEHMILYLMAIGAPIHPVSEQLWHTWKRPVGEYAGHISITCGPLFTHQYSHIWIDFRDKHDRYADYFENSREATLANRAFCIDQKKKFKTYDEDIWGLTASDAPDGYRAYGSPPSTPVHDGTIAPTGAGASIVFTPELSIQCMTALKDRFGGKLWGRYGFSDAFNVDKDWWDKDVLAIDQGAMMLMMENYRSGLIWNLFMDQDWVKRAMDRAGFTEGSKHLTTADVTLAPAKIKSAEDRPKITAWKSMPDPVVDGKLDEWNADTWTELSYPADAETGRRNSAADLSARFSIRRTAAGIAVAVDVEDNDVQNTHSGQDLYRGDLVEIYLDPQGNNLQWGSSSDFQIGVSPVSSRDDGGADWYAWFQNGRPKGIDAAAAKTDRGYQAELRIAWSAMGNSVPGRVGISVAVHDVDADTTPECKLQWFFLDPGIVLGELMLAEPDTGLLADFNSGERINNVGGEFGGWNKDPKDTTQGTTMEFSTEPDRTGRCLVLTYDVDSPRPAYNGFWMNLQGFDASRFSRLSFSLRGDASKGFPGKIKIEMKRGSAQSSVYVDKIQSNWITVRIPKSKFNGLTDWSNLSQFVIVFEDHSAGRKTGEIRIDDVKFE